MGIDDTTKNQNVRVSGIRRHSCLATKHEGDLADGGRLGERQNDVPCEQCGLYVDTCSAKD